MWFTVSVIVRYCMYGPGDRFIVYILDSRLTKFWENKLSVWLSACSALIVVALF